MDNHGFVSAGGLREIDIGHKDKLGPTYVSAKSNPEVRAKIDRFKGNLKVVWLNDMPGLDRSIV